MNASFKLFTPQTLRIVGISAGVLLLLGLTYVLVVQLVLPQAAPADNRAPAAGGSLITPGMAGTAPQGGLDQMPVAVPTPLPHPQVGPPLKLPQILTAPWQVNDAAYTNEVATEAVARLLYSSHMDPLRQDGLQITLLESAFLAQSNSTLWLYQVQTAAGLYDAWRREAEEVVQENAQVVWYTGTEVYLPAPVRYDMIATMMPGDSGPQLRVRWIVDSGAGAAQIYDLALDESYASSVLPTLTTGIGQLTGLVTAAAQAPATDVQEAGAEQPALPTPLPTPLPGGGLSTSDVASQRVLEALQGVPQATPTAGAAVIQTQVVVATPTPGTCQAAVCATVITNKGNQLNVRSGPGLGYEIVRTLDPGTVIYPIIQDLDPQGEIWYQLRAGGWVYGPLINIFSGDPAAIPVAP